MDIIIAYLTSAISSYGYLATFFLMAIESCNIPVPSEIILPFSGFLVSQKSLSFWGMVLAGSLGCVLGSDISYALGKWGGKPFLYKYGKYLLISKKDLEVSDKWFDKYGNYTVFISRILPIIRTFISFPAGIHEINFLRFNIFTFIGSFIWSYILVYLGFLAGKNWEIIRIYVEKFGWVIAGIILVVIIWYIVHKIRKIKNEK